jgi:hypothetical protein
MNLLDDSNGNSLEEIMNAERQDQHEASSRCLQLFSFNVQHFRYILDNIQNYPLRLLKSQLYKKITEETVQPDQIGLSVVLSLL